MITIDKLTEGLELDAVKYGIVYVLKKTFLSKKAKAFYKNVYETTKLLILVFTLLGLLSMILKGKLPNNTKVIIAVGFMLGISLLCYLNSKKLNSNNN